MSYLGGVRVCGEVLGASATVDSIVNSATKAFNAARANPELSAAELAKLDRKLTPAEQKKVDDYQASPVAETSTVTMDVQPGGATLTKTPGALAKKDERPIAGKGLFDDVPAWQVLLGSVGLAGVGYGLYRMGS